ncbi:hypothetical protein RKE57_21130 [Stenotrophomonas geniculata]|uniref:hypothetical protein n=1 Tax=Stenotrophomonas geniculata TaxID=86188 RepID=UPI00287F4BAE|nr:hypothetical protein [Stenotrophomonas geniculata]WNF10518.1 hypothetical protein RKE57_21130 [Stenotrophomonas geniculata]
MTRFYPAADKLASMHFDEFLENVKREVDFRDVESIAAMAQPMQRLAVDSGWFIDYLNSELVTGFQSDESQVNLYSSNSFVLNRGTNYLFRANVWLPSDDPMRAEGDKPIFAEDLLHDHNFHLLTIGLLGDGYETDIFDYDYDSCLGYPGEKVHCSDVQRYKLHQGSSLFMIRGKTIHRQLPPETVSVSLNLMSQTPDSVNARQYGFVERPGGGLEISSVHYETTQNPGASENIINICGSFANDQTKDILFGIYGRIAKRADRNEPLVLLLRDWMPRLGVSLDDLPPLRGAITDHLKRRLEAP